MRGPHPKDGPRSLQKSEARKARGSLSAPDTALVAANVNGFLPAKLLRRPNPTAAWASAAAESATQDDAAEDYAAWLVRDVERRTLSAIFRGLPRSYDTAIAAGLNSGDLFGYPEYAELFRVLMTIGQRRDTQPTVEHVRQACAEAFGLRFEHRQSWAAEWDELRDDILECECSAAGLSNYCRLILAAARRRRQVRRLWKALGDRVSDPFGEAKPAVIIVTREPRRIKRKARHGCRHAS
jgi:hypothetical protein